MSSIVTSVLGKNISLSGRNGHFISSANCWKLLGRTNSQSFQNVLASISRQILGQQRKDAFRLSAQTANGMRYSQNFPRLRAMRKNIGNRNKIIADTTIHTHGGRYVSLLVTFTEYTFYMFKFLCFRIAPIVPSTEAIRQSINTIPTPVKGLGKNRTGSTIH